MLVKICGLVRQDDVEAAVSAGADLVGFVFVPGTPRAVTVDRVRWVRDLAGAETVGVFRDAALEEVERAREQLELDWVQLHGREPDAWLRRLGPRVIRAVRVGASLDWVWLRRLCRHGLPLLDPGGGSGRAFDWRLLEGRPRDVRIGLAGGLTPDTVAAAVATACPTLVDVSSGVEVRPGVKDHDRIRRFVSEARRVEHGTMNGHGREV